MKTSTKLLFALAAAVSVDAKLPLVHSPGEQLCMTTTMTSVQNGYVLAANYPCKSKRNCTVGKDCPDDQKWTIAEDGKLKTDMGICATRVSRSVGLMFCDDTRVKEMSKWEAYDNTGARLQKGHGYRVGQLELRCIQPDENKWTLVMCADEPNPCPPNQCLSDQGFCGNSPDHCNANSLRGMAGVLGSPPAELKFDPPKYCPSSILTDKQLDGVILASTRECVKDGWQLTDKGQYKLNDNLCATRVGRSLGLKSCDGTELSLWEKYDNNGARLQKGQGFVLNKAELRCMLARPEKNSWEFAFCADEPNPCPKGQCLSARGECGNTPDHCNETSLRGLSQIQD